MCTMTSRGTIQLKAEGSGLAHAQAARMGALERSHGMRLHSPPSRHRPRETSSEPNDEILLLLPRPLPPALMRVS